MDSRPYTSRESNPGPLGRQPDLLTTIPNRREDLLEFNKIINNNNNNNKHQLLIYVDDVNMLGQNLQTVRVRQWWYVNVQILVDKQSFIHHSLLKFKLPHIGAFTSLTPPRPYNATTCRERELTLDHIHSFLTTQGHGVSPQMRNKLNSWATSETIGT